MALELFRPDYDDTNSTRGISPSAVVIAHGEVAARQMATRIFSHPTDEEIPHAGWTVTRFGQISLPAGEPRRPSIVMWRY